jgi:ribosomal-protein-alanine N-acetyltransferase
MTKSDIDAVVQIEKELFVDDPWTVELFREELAEVGNSREVVCAWDGDSIVGYASLRYVGGEGDINTIAVAANHQGRGIGRSLMNWLYAAAAEHKVRDLFLEVRSDNEPAIAMYSKDDFVRIDKRKNYYGTDIDAIVMRKKLAS